MDAFFEIQITCNYNYVIFIECIFLNNVLCSNNVMEGKRIFIKQLHMQPGKLLVAFVFCNVYR